MEIILKILAAICYTIIVVFIAAGVIFAILTIEFKILLHRRKRIKEQLSKEEMRLLELSSLVNQFMVSVNSYISEIANKRQELLSRKLDCKCSQANNTENQNSEQQISPLDNQG